jgi:dTDP-4-dehydrorhamnose reductase
MNLNKNIIILGSDGMLGHTVCNYLKAKNKNTFGTTRIKNNTYYLSTDTFKKDFKKIYAEVKKLDFIINCIGQTSNRLGVKRLKQVNSDFPKELELTAKNIKAKLIHISTDAVYKNNSGYVTEQIKPTPEGSYGKSKLLGETSLGNAITIRTSIIGLNPKSHRGLLEWIINNSHKKINGYENQMWTGCTTLQFAKLCYFLLKSGNFKKTRELSPIFNYSPLGPITKYELIRKTLRILNINRQIKKSNSIEKIDRKLGSVYNIFPKEKNFNEAIKELLEFEEK